MSLLLITNTFKLVDDEGSPTINLVKLKFGHTPNFIMALDLWLKCIQSLFYFTSNE